MFRIDDIKSNEILELVKYQQPETNYVKITLLRGYNWYARCVNDRLQHWTVQDDYDHARELYQEGIDFEIKLGSKKL